VTLVAASYGFLGESNHPAIVEIILTGLKTVAKVSKCKRVLCGENFGYQVS
jgi:hypothetical protein